MELLALTPIIFTNQQRVNTTELVFQIVLPHLSITETIFWFSRFGTMVFLSIYNAQYLNTYGYVPYQKVLAELTVTGTTTTGQKTMVLSSNISLSGTGPGVYFVVQRYNSSTSNPTLRFGTPILGGLQTILPLQFQTGFVFNTAGTGATSPIRNIGTSTATMFSYTNATFPTTWTSTELNTLTASLSSNILGGFLLHTVK